MNQTTHTHKGTCQACGRTQAVDNGSKLIAKHGYTVDSGYFNGTCQGSDKKPAQLDLTLTNTVIAFCKRTALVHDQVAAALVAGKTVPATFERWNPNKVVLTTRRNGSTRETKGGYDVLPLSQATVAERAKAIKNAIAENEGQAAGLRMHERMLVTFVVPKFNTPLFDAAELNKPVAKPAAPTVDVKAAKVTGTYATKAARKDALDKLNRQYEKAHRALQDMYLALSDSERTEARTQVYYGPYQLSNWNAKRAAAALAAFPQAAALVTEMNELAAARLAVKAAP